MWVRHLASVGGVVLGLLVTVQAQAACTMDNDCPGEQVCEEGQCVVAPLPPPPPPPQAAPAPQQAAPAAAAPVPQQAVPAAPAMATSPAEVPPEPPPADKPKGPRHSKGMMVTGIILTSTSPIGLLIFYGGVLRCSGGLDDVPCNSSDQKLAGLLLAGALAGVGIPLWIIGGRRDPVPGTPQARISPWLTPRAGGLSLQLDL